MIPPFRPKQPPQTKCQAASKTRRNAEVTFRGTRDHAGNVTAHMELDPFEAASWHNELVVAPPGTISVDDESSGKPAEHAATLVTDFYVFDVKLQHPFNNYLDLDTDINFGESRWVVVEAWPGREYNVLLKKMYNYHSLSDGWELIAARERFQEEENVRFQYVEDSFFRIMPNPTHHDPLMQVDGPSNSGTYKSCKYYLGNRTILTHQVRACMQTACSALGGGALCMCVL